MQLAPRACWREVFRDCLPDVRRRPPREHLVEILNTVYPPKQGLATVTGLDRTTFTTMEAQRVLTRAGFVCRRAGEDDECCRGWVVEQSTDDEAESTSHAEAPDSRLARVEAALTIAQEAIASLVPAADLMAGPLSGHPRPVQVLRHRAWARS
jgi:hypothetical protein